MPDVVAPTVGDPQAMRALAGELLSRADLIGGVPSNASTPLDDATFEGRAAERIRVTVTDARTQVVEAASRLREVASRLLSDAAEVERQNALLQAEAEAAAAAAAEAAAKPQHTPGQPALPGGVGTNPQTTPTVPRVDVPGGSVPAASPPGAPSVATTSNGEPPS